MDIECTWTYWQGKINRQFSLSIWTSFIGQFVHAVGGEGIGYRVIYEYYVWKLNFDATPDFLNSYKLKHAVGLNNDLSIPSTLPHPLPSFCMNVNWPINEFYASKLNWRQFSPVIISTYILYPLLSINCHVCLNLLF